MKAVMFDFDGTLSRDNNAWMEVWKYIGKLDKDKELYQRFDNGELTYQGWCDEVCKVFKENGVTEEKLPLISKQIKLIDGAKETFSILKKAGYSLNIVSGGIKQLIVGALGENVKYFDHISANRFVFDENGILQNFDLTRFNYQGKADFVTKYCQKYDISPNNVWFVGDSYNDELVYTSGCHTICINPQYKVTKGEVWNEVIEKATSLKQILPYVGVDINKEREL